MSTIAIILMILGAVNWGLVGLFRFNLVTAIFGTSAIALGIVYTIIALGGIWGIVMLCRGDLARKRA
ncbi:MAG: DUF378 domain-containing protein [Clostridiales bacterium]|nr:DUF378 domain-containing protein [Clostridiales bacterium]